MTAIIAIVVLVIIIVVIAVLFAGGGLAKKSAEQGDQPVRAVHGPGVLRYHPPVGQDAAIVVAALQKEGFEAASENVRGTTLIIVQGGAADRERVRQAIRTASGSAFNDPGLVQDDIRFEDEQ